MSAVPSLDPERLLTVIAAMPLAATYWVAYSGGLDSSVLLHAMAALRERLPGALRAIHVHHGLQHEADAWAAHCRRSCDRLGVPLEVCELALVPRPGESLEAFARAARYQAMAGAIGAGDMLLTAHHQDDQAETVLLHLLRGSGVDGLAAMPRVMRWRRGYLARPLLDWSRQQLRGYAEQARLEWVDDPSNRETAFDRNYLRREIVPRLKTRWPATAAAFARSAGHCADARRLLRDLAEIDLSAAGGGGPDRLKVAVLERLTPARRRNLLRHWIRRQGMPVPGAAAIERILSEVAGAGCDRTPVFRWRGAEVRRFRGELYLMPPLPSAPDPSLRLDWKGDAPLPLPDALGRLSLREIRGEGIDHQIWRKGHIQVGFRQGGERGHPCGQAHHRTLKHLFQAWGIPPWLRDRIPLIFIDGRLAAVAGEGVFQPFCATPDAMAVSVIHTRPTRPVPKN